MKLDADIIDCINVDFAGTDAQVAQEEISASGKAGRIARYIVVASAGSLQNSYCNGCLVSVSIGPAYWILCTGGLPAGWACVDCHHAE